MIPSRILVATDGSPSAMAAEAYAAEMAVAHQAETLLIVTVMRPMAGLRAVTGPSDDSRAEVESGDELVEAAAERIQAAMGKDAVSVAKKVLVATSEAEAIVKAARELGASAQIVMGARGHGGFANLLLGSTSHQVIQGADCPVTVVRA